MNEFDVIKIKAEAYKETGGDKGMIDFNTLKCRKTKMGREASWYSLLSSKGIDITFISLIITLLIFGLGGQSAFSQYRDLSVADVQGVSSRSGIFARDRISVSQGLSDEFALNEMDSNGSIGENSGGSIYAANNERTNSNPAASDPKDWEFIVAPYLWLSNINGDITVRGIQSHVDLGFIDALKHLDFAFAFHGEVWWKGKLGIFVDPYYVRLSDNQEVELPHFNINAELTATTWIVEFGGIYRVGTWPVGSPYNNFVQKAEPSVTLELLAGGRYWRLKNELDIEGSRGFYPRKLMPLRAGLIPLLVDVLGWSWLKSYFFRLELI